MLINCNPMLILIYKKTKLSSSVNGNRFLNVEQMNDELYQNSAEDSADPESNPEIPRSYRRFLPHLNSLVGATFLTVSQFNLLWLQQRQGLK